MSEHPLEQYGAAWSLERYLGDPWRADSRVPFSQVLELDEREEYPDSTHAAFDAWGVPEFYIPQEIGGRLSSFEQLLAIVRVLSRRDLTATISHCSSFLGAAPIWIGGNVSQKRFVAEILRGGQKIAFALSERNHGTDLLANEVQAAAQTDHLVLRGEKWMVGNATRCAAMSVLARTQSSPGPRSLSLLLVDKERLDAARYEHLPKLPTVGLRGSDLSGIRFDDCMVAGDALIGPAGSGFELALKALQITRTMCAGLSLGAADTALRVTLDFALSRQLYNASVFSMPHARHALSCAFLELLMCECAAIGAARALHFSPEQCSLWSAITKAFVPSTIEGAFRNMAGILGARFFVRGGHAWPMFQKMQRDSAIISIFEGSTLVQQHLIGMQLDSLLRSSCKENRCAWDRLQNIFSLSAPLEPFNASRLDLASHGRNNALDGLKASYKQLSDSDASAKILIQIRRTIERFDSWVAQASKLSTEHDKSPARLQLAWAYATLHVAACCIHYWLFNRNSFDEFLRRGEWLELCLKYLNGDTMAFEDTTGVGEELLRRFQQGQLFSPVPFGLAVKGQAA